MCKHSFLVAEYFNMLYNIKESKQTKNTHERRNYDKHQHCKSKKV